MKGVFYIAIFCGHLNLIKDHCFLKYNFLQIKLNIGVTWFWLRFSTHSLGGRSWTKYEKFHKMHMRWLFPGHHWHFGRSCDTQFENWETKKSWTYPRFQQTNAKRCYRRRKTDTQGKKKKQLSGTFFWTTHATFTCANCPSFPDNIKDILWYGWF